MLTESIKNITTINPAVPKMTLGAIESNQAKDMLTFDNQITKTDGTANITTEIRRLFATPNLYTKGIKIDKHTSSTIAIAPIL